MELGHGEDHLVADTRSGAEEKSSIDPGRQHAKPERKWSQKL